MSGKRTHLRWKRHPRKTGLRSIGAAPRGWDLHDGANDYATVFPNGGDWIRKQNGWYWVALGREGVPYKNTRYAPVATPEEAKAAAMAYVKAHLAGATP